MEEQDQNEKKAWLAPVIEDLDIEETSSGAFDLDTEDAVYNPASFS